MRRLFWLSIGTVAGAAGTVWTERKIKERLDALAPDHAMKLAADKAKDAGRNVVEAVTEGRSAMVEREQELRARRDAGRAPNRPGLRIVDSIADSIVDSAVDGAVGGIRTPGRPSASGPRTARR